MGGGVGLEGGEGVSGNVLNIPLLNFNRSISSTNILDGVPNWRYFLIGVSTHFLYKKSKIYGGQLRSSNLATAIAVAAPNFTYERCAVSGANITREVRPILAIF